MEQSISSHLFHPHWNNIRKSWNLSVMSAIDPVNFAKVMMWLVACIKPVVFNPVWHDSLGHVRFNRVTALEREEKKKQEKRDKKDPDQDEYRLMTIVKYTLGLKHQVWKLKGEEYRMHALWGWQWLASHRRTCHVPMSTVGLRAGPEKMMVPIKGTAGLRSLSVNPSIYKQLTAKSPSLKPTLLSPKQLAEEAANAETPVEEKKNEIIIAGAGGQQKMEVGKVKLEEMFEDGLINVSKALSSKFRFIYPKVAKQSTLDSLLSRRLALRTLEEKDLANKKLVGNESKTEEEEDEVDVENDDTDATLSDDSDHENIDEIPDSQRSTIHKQRPAGNLLKEMRSYKLKYETLDDLDSNYSCYSVMCRKSGRCNCYSPMCLLKVRTKDKLVSSVRNYRIVTSKPSPFDEVGSHSPVRLSSLDLDSGSMGKGESGSENVTSASTSATTSTVTTVNGQIVNTETADSSDGRSSRASSEIKIRMDEDIDETSQGSASVESKFSLKNSRVYSAESTSGKVYLKKISNETKRARKLQYRIPPLSSFKVGKKVGSVDKRLSSILVLPKWELRMLARKGGRYYVAGFNHNAKANNSVWQYPCSRPAFKTVWQYRTSTMPTLNSVAMQLRILWVCLRWDDMQEKGPGDGRKQITTDVEIVQTEILKRKHFGRFLEKTEYLRRKVTIPFDVPKPVREFTPSQRSGLRKRRRAQSPVNKEPQSIEEWVDEDRLDLWEIRFFGERLEKAATITKKSIGEKGECIQTVTTRGSSPAEIRARLEEQLKIQRANFNQKKALESTPPAKSGIVKLSVCSIGGTVGTPTVTKLAIPSKPNATTKVVQTGGSAILAIGGQLPSIAGKKIVATRDGRIITVQTSNPSSNNVTGTSQAQTANSAEKSSINLGSSTIFPLGSSAKVQVTSQGNKVIRLQAMTSSSGQRIIHPRSPTTTVVQTRSPRPAAPSTLPTAVATNTTTNASTTPSATTPTRTVGQQIQIVRLPDGQLTVRGLQEGQQLVQRPDGKFQLINRSQIATTSSVQSSSTSNTSPAVQVTQQTKIAPPVTSSNIAGTAGSTESPSKVSTAGTSPSSNTHVPNATSSHVVKVNGMQVLLKQVPDNKQVVTVGASEAAATATAVSANSIRPTAVIQGAQTSPRIKTMLAPDGTMVKTVLSTAAATSNLSPSTTTAASNAVATTTTSTGEAQAAPASQTPALSSGSSLTLKVQVRMTEQGPKTIIQGLQPGVGLTKDHIMAIQQQVRNMLAQYNLQVNQLSPLMTLTLHVPNKPQVQPSTATAEKPQEGTEEQKKATTQSVPQQAQGNTTAAAFKSLLSPQSQVTTHPQTAVQSPAVIAVKNASAESNTKLSTGSVPETGESGVTTARASEDGVATTPASSQKKFVITQEYINQTIKSALSKEDLAPDIEEKLIQLQKYNSEQIKKDDTVGVVGTISTPAVVNSASSRNSAVKRSREPEDLDWNLNEEKTANLETPTPSKPRPKKSRSDSRPSESSKPKKSAAKNEALDIRKKQALLHKLDSLMTRHKDFLKKDILKKRAQLEKELQVEIHKELSVARQQLQLLEKNKVESSLQSSSLSPRKKKTASESSPSQVVSMGANQISPEAARLAQASPPSQNNIGSSKSSSSKSPSKPSSKSASSKKSSKNKNKKIVCICRTPFDDTKFYVGCDLCGNWFHGDCVGITEAMSHSMTEYVCDDCANAKLNKELFCFCRQPYDETQFYICCEQCEDWYHGKCVGIMQSEADDIDDYICPKCDSNNVWNYPCQKSLSAKDYVELKKLTKGLIQHKNAWPFLEPVDPSEVPDYYKVVKEPMDLKTVESRVETKSYQRLAQFIGDVMLVFDNCRLYNPPNSSFCSCAATLESFFCQKLKSLKTRLSQR
ncbi:hypothetical protein SK128_021119 [Halocaridina rubra]|uniref:Nucleosome-remodeling factor subunit NURF301 n=1 Tax=Halocaridina rubra TaxID=373956 RepID=A0AAN9ABJ2_HALRR